MLIVPGHAHAELNGVHSNAQCCTHIITKTDKKLEHSSITGCRHGLNRACQHLEVWIDVWRRHNTTNLANSHQSNAVQAGTILADVPVHINTLLRRNTALL